MLVDDSWADGLARPAQRLAAAAAAPAEPAAVAAGGVGAAANVGAEHRAGVASGGAAGCAATGAGPRDAGSRPAPESTRRGAVAAEREELLAKLLRLIPHAHASLHGGISTSTLRTMVERGTAQRESETAAGSGAAAAGPRPQPASVSAARARTRGLAAGEAAGGGPQAEGQREVWSSPLPRGPGVLPAGRASTVWVRCACSIQQRFAR
ncbi:unnamed protein product, partial [Prorocentrum cordatum]